jgi:hypothetical protein
LVDVFRAAVFFDAGRFPNRRAINFLALDSRHENAWLGARGENAPWRGDSLGCGGGGPTASGGKNHVSETTAAAIEDHILDFTDVLAA